MLGLAKIKIIKRGFVEQWLNSVQLTDHNVFMLNDRLIVPSKCFKQTSFLKSVNKGPPLSSTFHINAK